MSVSTVYDVVVIGGGIAGLTVAHICSKQGLKILVIESADDIGGKCKSYTDNNFLFGQDDTNKFGILKPVDNLVLPGEHSFRSISSNYINLRSIMGEIEHPRGGTVEDQITSNIISGVILDLKTLDGVGLVQWLMAKLETIFILVALITPYILCKDRAIKNYKDVSFFDLLNYKWRSSGIKKFFFKMSGFFVGYQPETVGGLEMTNAMLNFGLSGDNGRSSFKI